MLQDQVTIDGVEWTLSRHDAVLYVGTHMLWRYRATSAGRAPVEFQVPYAAAVSPQDLRDTLARQLPTRPVAGPAVVRF